MNRKALAGLSSLATLALLPSTAAACPACARDATPHLGVIVGALLLVPFALAAGIVWTVRQGTVEEER